MAAYIYNTTGAEKFYAGQTVGATSYLLIEESKRRQFSFTNNLLVDIANGVAIISKSDASGGHISGISAQIDYLKSDVAKDVIVLEQPPFSSKLIGTKKLYTRATGVSHAVVVGANTLDFLIPYNEMKFNGIEIVNAKVGEKVSLKILDTATGTITTVPNYLLNQFGFNVNLPDGFYARESMYDADLIKDLVVRIEFTAIEARNVGINYLIHELKI